MGKKHLLSLKKKEKNPYINIPIHRKLLRLVSTNGRSKAGDFCAHSSLQAERRDGENLTGMNSQAIAQHSRRRLHEQDHGVNVACRTAEGGRGEEGKVDLK